MLNIPSERLQFAVEALKWWESLPNHAVDPGHFHRIAGNKLYANLGGAASIRLWVHEEEAHPDIQEYQDIVGFGNCNRREVYNFEASLDFASKGRTEVYFRILDFDKDIGKRFDREITNYYKCPKNYYIDLNRLIEDLKREGY